MGPIWQRKLCANYRWDSNPSFYPKEVAALQAVLSAQLKLEGAYGALRETLQAIYVGYQGHPCRYQAIHVG